MPKLGEARQKNIFSSEKFLKQADLHGDPLYFEAISVLNDIESAASKWFTDRLLSWIWIRRVGQREVIVNISSSIDAEWMTKIITHTSEGLKMTDPERCSTLIKMR